MSVKFSLWWRVPTLAVAYFLAGQLSLLLAIPPGFATPVWPAAGIALAAVLVWGYGVVPGVLAGSFAVNLALAAQSAADLSSATTYLMALGIACGAALQAAMAAWLVVRFAWAPSRLTRAREVFGLVVVGGGVGCLISGLLGPLSLLSAGVIPESAYAVSALTWWAGDAIGVTLMTPVLLLASHAGVSTGRKLAVGVPILAFIGLVVIVFFTAKGNDRERQQLAFEADAKVLTADFTQRLNAYIDVLTATQKFMEASDVVTFAEFRRFTREFTIKYPGIYSVAWLPRITADKRALYEEAMSAELDMPVRIFDRAKLGKFVAAPERELYFPVTYSVPLERNRAAIGLDTYGPDGAIGYVRRDALDRARDYGRAESSGRITIVQDESQLAVVVYNPVYAGGSVGDDVVRRREALSGYTAGVFLIPPLMESLAHRAASQGMSVRLHSLSAPAGQQLLYDSSNTGLSELGATVTTPQRGLQYREALRFASKDWQLQFIQAGDPMMTGKGLGLWYLLLGGLFLSSLFGAFLIVLSASLDGPEIREVERANWLALASAASTAVILLLVAGVAVNHLRNRLDAAYFDGLDYDLQVVSQGIREQTRLAVSSLRRMARRDEAGAMSDAHWEVDAENYLQDITALRAIAYLDPAGKIMRYALAAPLDTRDITSLFAMVELPEADALGAQQGIYLSPGLSPPGSDSGLVAAFAPVYRGERVAGYVAGVLDVGYEFRSMVPVRQRERHRVQVADGPVPLFTNGDWRRAESQHEREVLIPVLNREWVVRIRPSSGVKQQEILPHLLAAAGGLLALLAAFVVYVATIASQRSRLLQENARELTRSEDRLNLILKSAGEGIFGIDAAGRTTFMNPAACEMLGYTSAELVHRRQHEIIHHSTRDGEPIAAEDCKILAALREGKAYSDDTEVFWRKDGRPFAVEYTSAPLREDKDAVVGAVVVFRDITRRKQAEGELLAANAELEEFAYRTSHDLRSPLVSSVELLNLTRRFYDEGDQEQALFSLTMAQQGLRRLDALVQSILQLTRTKKLEEQRSRVDFAELIDAALKKMSHLPGFARLRIQTDIDVPAEIWLMRSRMELIAENLISNAIKYQDPEQPEPVIRISARVDGRRFVFSVEDNGLGVPEGQQDKLFSMFKRLHSDVSYGSGLGLYMVKKSAEVMGGTIRYQPGKVGACFQLEILLPE